MNDEDIKLEALKFVRMIFRFGCLKLARSLFMDEPRAEDIVTSAKVFEKFMLGKDDEPAA